MEIENITGVVIPQDSGVLAERQHVGVISVS
jgi:hypothetical protein